MTCTSCGREGGDGTFCRLCSAALKAVCPQGHTSPPGSRFCPECRAPIAVHPAPPNLLAGCLARALAWAVTLGILALAGHLLRRLTPEALLAVLGFFGIERSDLCNACTILVVVPAVIGIVSFMLPDPLGPAVRRGVWWAVRTAYRLLWQAACAVGRAVWLLAEGQRPNAGDSRRK